MPKSIPKSLPHADDHDYVKERQAAMVKLINVWSSLAEKYSRPLEEDDIVDILTGEVVKDRGVISSWDGSQQSFFTGKTLGRDQSRKGGDTSEEETNEQVEEKVGETNEEALEGRGDEFDELDSFATEVGHDIPHATEKGVKDEFDELDSFATEVGRDVPHATKDQETTETAEHHSDANVIWPLPSTDRLDDEDLREFLDAEKQRRDLYGDDDSSDSDFEQFRTELRQFRHRSSCIEAGGRYPPFSSPSLLLSSSPVRTSWPTVSPPSPSAGTSNSSTRMSLLPLKALSLSKRPSNSSGRASVSSAHTSYSRTSSSSCRAPPTPSSSVRKWPSILASPWPSSSPAPPIFPSFRPSSSIPQSSPGLLTPSSVASSSSARLSTPPIPPSSSSSVRSSSPHPASSSSARSSSSRLPFSSPVRSSACLIPLPFDSESEDELLRAWAPNDKVSKVSPKLKQPRSIQEARSKTIGTKPKRTPKRKRVVTSSEEESSDSTRVHSLSMISSTRARSMSPKKRIVDKGVLYSVYDDKGDEQALKLTLKPPRYKASNG